MGRELSGKPRVEKAAGKGERAEEKSSNVKTKNRP
jgi:hypothetical protein